ncbi:T9SS type A sorting domain-containing protein [candidate division KSB1 bacterium]|nr:T9SS type A sorting domain-containing protein [candidate division KSB1 bacterium]
MYVEGYNFAEDHHESDFFNSLGCAYVADGNEVGDIWFLEGDSNTFVENMYFDYGHFPSPIVRTDVIGADEGQLLFSSQDSMGYAVAYDNGNYKVVTSTFLLGALIDGEAPNTKVELMRRYLQFFEGTLSVEEINSRNSTPEKFTLNQNYPNPFKNTTVIEFNLVESSDHFWLTIFNMLGQEVKRLNYFNGFNGNYSLIWDGTNKNNEFLPSGTYIYQLKVGEKSISRRMNLIR